MDGKIDIFQSKKCFVAKTEYLYTKCFIFMVQNYILEWRDLRE